MNVLCHAYKVQFKVHLLLENEESSKLFLYEPFFRLFILIRDKLHIFQKHFETSNFAPYHHNQKYNRASLPENIEGDIGVWKIIVLQSLKLLATYKNL